MIITVNQRRWSFTSKYDISGDAGSYYAQKKLFSFTDRLKIFSDTGEVAARIVGYFTFFLPKYDFIIDGIAFKFRTVKFWKGVFTCDGNGRQYKLLRHRDRNYSIFEGELQVGAFYKPAIKIGNGDVYTIEADDGQDVLILLCLALTVDSSENEDNDGSTATIDLGNFGPEERPFNNKWRPKTV